MSEIVSTRTFAPGETGRTYDRRCRAVAILLHLKAAAKMPEDRLAASAIDAAPTLLELLGLPAGRSGEGGIDGLIPMRELKDYEIEKDDLAAATGDLILLLQSDYRPHAMLERKVLDTMLALRHALAAGHVLARLDPALGVRFADRVWEVERRPVLYRTIRGFGDLASITVILLLTFIMLPMLAARNVLERFHPTAHPSEDAASTPLPAVPEKPHKSVSAAAADLHRALGMTTKEELAVIDRMRLSAEVLGGLANAHPHLKNDDLRLKRHFTDLAARAFAASAAAKGLSPEDRTDVLRSVETIASAMDEVAARPRMQAIEDLRAEMRFIETAHGTHPESALNPMPRNDAL